MAAGRLESDIPFGKVAGNAIGGGEAKCTPAAKDDGVTMSDKVRGGEDIGFARGGCATPDINGRERAAAAEDGRASGCSPTICPVPNADAGNVGNGVTRARTERFGLLWHGCRSYADWRLRFRARG